LPSVCGAIPRSPFRNSFCAPSGTTLAAAESTGRVCCGVEIDPKYVDVVIERWQKMTGTAAALDDDGRSFEDVRIERWGGA
jgi:hypothetical protein